MWFRIVDLFHKIALLAGCVSAEWAMNDRLQENCRGLARRLGIEEDDSRKVGQPST